MMNMFSAKYIQEIEFRIHSSNRVEKELGSHSSNRVENVFYPFSKLIKSYKINFFGFLDLYTNSS